MSLLEGALTNVGGLLGGPPDGPTPPSPPPPPPSRPTDVVASSARTSATSTRSPTPSRSAAAEPDDDSDSDSDSDGESDDEDDEEEEIQRSSTGSATPSGNRALVSTTSSISSSATTKPALASVSLHSETTSAPSSTDTGLTSGPQITSGSSTYPAAWSRTTSDSITISTLIVAGPAISASLAEGNRGFRDENIFHTHNKLFPLAVIAVVVASLFFLLTAAFFFIRFMGWNRKRRTRKLTPSFYVDRNTMFEPKFDMIGTTGNLDTGPYNPVASTVDLHRNGSRSTTGSDRAMYNVAAPAPLIGPASTLPSDRFDEGDPYDGAFFPSSQPDKSNPFLRPGEYYPGTQPTSRTLLASSSPDSQQTQASAEDEVGSPVPSFNTGRVYAQAQPAQIGIPARGLSIPPPYQTPPARSNGTNLHDEYKFDMLTREPSNGSNLMSRTRAMKAGVRQIGKSSTSEWQEGRRGEGSRSEDEESIIESYVSAGSSKLAKKPTWGSDRV